MKKTKINKEKKTLPTKSNTTSKLKQNKEETQTQKSYDVWRFEPYPYKPITAEDLF